jgi:type II secretory pathway pseudopilin PulG
MEKREMSGIGIGFVLLFLLNFGISWLNAWGVGRTWEESKAAGGFSHFVTWCAAVMSASGFTWCYTLILALIAGSVPYKGHILLAPRYVEGMIELGYVIIILPILGSGLGITISSWRDFSRRRSLATGGVAGYNTFAQVYNTVQAVRVLPGIFGDLGKLFNSKDKDSNGYWLMILLVALAVLGGILTTATIIQRVAETQRERVRWQLEDAKAAARG